MPKNDLSTFLTDQQRQQARQLAPLQDAARLNPHAPALIDRFQQIPMLRGYWPMTSINESSEVLDLSGQGRTLSNINTLTYGVTDLVSYANHNNTGLLRRADEAGVRLSGAFSMGGYFYPYAAPVAVSDTLISKWVGGGAGQANYMMEWYGTTLIPYRGLVSSDGSNSFSVPSLVVDNLLNVWKLVIFRYFPSDRIVISVNENGRMIHDTNVTSIPASIYSASTANFEIGSQVGTNIFNGRSSNVFIAAAALSNGYVEGLFEDTRSYYEL